MRYFLFILLFVLAACNNAQDKTSTATLPPFWNDIQNFKKQDSISFPPKNAILFIGSSSFTMWKDVQSYFPGYTIINRGFGGSTLLDQIRYADDIIFPYEPKQVVIYCGENDLASSDTVTAKMVFDRFKRLYDTIANKLPYVHILYVSMKPSPSRRHLFSKMKDANAMIDDFIMSSRDTTKGWAAGQYIDVYTKMLNENHEPIPEFFLNDSLHMTAKGYAIWQKEMQPYLVMELEPVLQK